MRDRDSLHGHLANSSAAREAKINNQRIPGFSKVNSTNSSNAFNDSEGNTMMAQGRRDSQTPNKQKSYSES